MVDDGSDWEVEPGHWEREPAFSGRGGELESEEFDGYEDAYSYAYGIVFGGIDPFFSRAWSDVRVQQVRDSAGRFTSLWEVIVAFFRPASGEES